MKLELLAVGVDTVRVAHDFLNPLPMESPEYRADLAAAGWAVNVRSERHDVLGVLDSNTAFWQDEENPTIRAMVQNAGRSLVAEFSVPRVLTGSILNLQLGTPQDVLDVTEQVLQRIRDAGPAIGAVGEARWRRLDTAADIAAGDARPGLIAAAAQFCVPGARKITRNVFPGETGRVSTSQMTFRGYDKARELEHKSARVLRDLEPTVREQVLTQTEAYRSRGTVRLELAQTPKKRGLSGDDVQRGNIKFADTLTAGFRGGTLFIGGLDHIRRQVDGHGDWSTQRRNAMIAFAVRYAELGEDGMLASMPRATFYRNKKQFLEAGLRLDDLSSYTGELDLQPVIAAIRAS